MARTEDSLVAKQAEVTDRALAADPVEEALPEKTIGVPVRPESPAQGTWRTATLSTNNPVLPLLPQDPRRRSAVVVSDAAKAVVCSSPELAQAVRAEASTGSLDGFLLPLGVIIPVRNKAACWVTATSDATFPIHVSVLVEKDDE